MATGRRAGVGGRSSTTAQTPTAGRQEVQQSAGSRAASVVGAHAAGGGGGHGGDAGGRGQGEAVLLAPRRQRVDRRQGQGRTAPADRRSGSAPCSAAPTRGSTTQLDHDRLASGGMVLRVASSRRRGSPRCRTTPPSLPNYAVTYVAAAYIGLPQPRSGLLIPNLIYKAGGACPLHSRNQHGCEMVEVDLLEVNQWDIRVVFTFSTEPKEHQLNMEKGDGAKTATVEATAPSN